MYVTNPIYLVLSSCQCQSVMASQSFYRECNLAPEKIDTSYSQLSCLLLELMDTSNIQAQLTTECFISVATASDHLIFPEPFLQQTNTTALELKIKKLCNKTYYEYKKCLIYMSNVLYRMQESNNAEMLARLQKTKKVAETFFVLISDFPPSI